MRLKVGLVSEPNYFVYMLQCENGSYYTGYTTDIARRYQEHLDGTLKCKYTRSFKPVKIAQSWTTANSKSDALKIERYIKKLSKTKKQELVLYPAKLTTIFQCTVHPGQEHV